MTIPFQKGRYQVRFSRRDADVLACQTLRHRCFHGGEGVDADAFDARCDHLMVEDATGALVATARIAILPAGPAVMQGYVGQFYDLAPTMRHGGNVAEIGRFCIAPEACDGDVLRLGWGALTRMVDENGVATLIGCTSFAGTDPLPYAGAFALLSARYLGAAEDRPGIKAAETCRFAELPTALPDPRPLPPLLRTYLAMGGWVGDHLVIDRVMNTLHVFTCVDVAAVPPARAKALRAIAS